jgi:hypothetical protein
VCRARRSPWRTGPHRRGTRAPDRLRRPDAREPPNVASAILDGDADGARDHDVHRVGGIAFLEQDGAAGMETDSKRDVRAVSPVAMSASRSEVGPLWEAGARASGAAFCRSELSASIAFHAAPSNTFTAPHGLAASTPQPSSRPDRVSRTIRSVSPADGARVGTGGSGNAVGATVALAWIIIDLARWRMGRGPAWTEPACRWRARRITCADRSSSRPAPRPRT